MEANFALKINLRSGFPLNLGTVLGSILRLCTILSVAIPTALTANAQLRNATPLSASEWNAAYHQAKATQPDFKVRSVEDFKALNEVYQRMVSDGRVVNQFRLRSGETIQCVDIYSQTSFLATGRTGFPSPPVPPDTSNELANRSVGNLFGLDGSIDDEGHLRSCPEGSFPKLIPRLQELYRFASVDAYYSKYGNAEQAGRESGLGVIHEYAGALQVQPNWGSSAIFNPWSPAVAIGEFSLSQLWVTRGSGTDVQSAETGWQKYPSRYGDNNTHLFIFFTTNGYTSTGNNIGCYNLSCTGFVQTDNSVVIGGAFGATSILGGQQQEVPIAFIRDTNATPNWWLMVNNVPIGYYPSTLYDAQGIASFSDRVNFGGEIINLETGGSHTSTEMGSGHFPSEGAGRAAYMRNLQYRDTSNATQAASGLQRYVLASNGAQVTNYYDLVLNPTPVAGWGQYFYFGGPGLPARAKPFDFDGDGIADISVFRPTGDWYRINSSTNSFVGQHFGASGDLPAPMDYDGDAKVDIAVFRPSNGTWYRINSSTNTLVGIPFGQNGDLPVPADYDGDGKADICVYRPSAGIWYRLNSSNNQFVGVAFGTSTDKPAVGDFDEDLKADISVFRPSTGFWYRLNSSNGQFVSAQFGANGDKAVPADFDGDGKTDLAVFRPAAGDWYVSNSSNGALVGIHFGANGDLPAPADYDLDGKADYAVFRPSTGTWYLQRSFAGFTGLAFGTNGDIPGPNSFVY